ncbi:MAG: EAL domain-containing protein, partial [Gammaproteobacteria bacterium]|nr:EAL domain-containing protein [Gammaproteobacteria bacterium]
TCLAEPNRVHRWEIRKVCRDETVIWVRESIRVIDAGHGRFELLSVCENVTEAHRLSEKLAYQATHDALTELVNRAEFENRLFRVLATARKKNSHNALCFLDLDKFKIVNDTCGHAAGDSLLHQIAKVLQDRVRTRDTVARLGGDEFGVLMESCSLDNARRGANELRRAVEDFQFFWEGQVFNVGVSIGMVPVTQSSGDTAAVLNAADNACYMAKEQGRNRIYIDLENKDDPDLRSRAGERIAAINRNLEQNGFQLWSQPILTLGGSSTGVREFTTRYEIFVRMRDEQGGLTLPIAFLPAAERYSLAPKIDRWVVGATVDWLKRHPRHLSRLTMCSINLSGSTLAEENFPSFVIKQLVAAKIPAEKICFEISDASVIRNLPNAIQLVKALRSHGCLLAIDDFSGLSSIDYLKTLPVDFIKIGRIIVKDVVDDPIDRAMVKAVNDISHAMGKQTIATCVESEKTLLKLREIGVDYVQGIHLGKPAPLNVPNEFQVVKSA